MVQRSLPEWSNYGRWMGPSRHHCQRLCTRAVSPAQLDDTRGEKNLAANASSSTAMDCGPKPCISVATCVQWANHSVLLAEKNDRCVWIRARELDQFVLNFLFFGEESLNFCSHEESINDGHRELRQRLLISGWTEMKRAHLCIFLRDKIFSNTAIRTNIVNENNSALQ